jgi:hypothetical protein
MPLDTTFTSARARANALATLWPPRAGAYLVGNVRNAPGFIFYFPLVPDPGPAIHRFLGRLDESIISAPIKTVKRTLTPATPSSQLSACFRGEGNATEDTKEKLEGSGKIGDKTQSAAVKCPHARVLRHGVKL